MSYKQTNKTDESRTSVFVEGQIISLTPYDLITDELGLSVQYRVKKRNGVFATLERNDGTLKEFVTRIAFVSNPRSEVINSSGFCPCYAYDYNN